jgi:hypothetical protein
VTETQKTANKFGMLTVVERIGERFKCKCECGKLCLVPQQDLFSVDILPCLKARGF